MKNKLIIFLFITFVLCGGMANASADPAPLSEAEARQILMKIKDKEKDLRTFIAQVKQVKQTQLFKEPLHSEGMIYFDHSGRLLLKMTQPSPVIVFFNNDRLYIHYPDYGKTEETYIGNHFFEKYFGVGTSIDGFYEQYMVEIFPATGGGLYQLKMLPKEERMAKKIEMIEVIFRKDDMLPEQVRILEKDGDDTTINLKFISINQPLPKDIFDMDLGDPNQYSR
ncbi:MAG: outer membrane lipoprotein carrier protein LolA [Deltaproteobacteria bacterium]|nr:outer membrane lipoprotein carrier protein LolA [Deltaproteobacteria bacterium]